MDAQFLIEVETLAGALDQLDYFAVLKLPQGATPADIKAAYYRESRAYHPDRFAAFPNAALRELVGRVYRRINEAYTVLRDDRKRARYLADVTGPDRAAKLRFTEVDGGRGEGRAEAEARGAARADAERAEVLRRGARGDRRRRAGTAAERALKSALMYEPANARFKEQLEAVQRELDKGRSKGDAFRIK